MRYIGLSNWAAWHVAKAVGIAAARGYAPIASLQAYYTLAGRDLEREVIPMLHSEGVGLMVWSPLAGGFLSGKFTRDGEGEGRRADFDFPPVNKPRAYDVIDVLREISAASGHSVAQLALGWLLHQPAVSSVILGAKRPDQLADNLGAVDVAFSAEDLARLDAASKLAPRISRLDARAPERLSRAQPEALILHAFALPECALAVDPEGIAAHAAVGALRAVAGG